MGLFGKGKASKGSVFVSVAPKVQAGPALAATAETELARNTSKDSSKQDPLLVEMTERSVANDASMMMVSQSKSEERQPNEVLSSTEPINNNVEREATPVVVPRDFLGGNDDAPDPELGAIVPLGLPPQVQKIPDQVVHGDATTESEQTALTEMREGSIPNPETLVMGQLIQWKFNAEEGSLALRIPAVLGALGIMGTTLVPLILYYTECLTPRHVIIAFFVVQMAVIICVIDGRFSCARDPLGSRAKLRNMVTRHFNVFRLVWGRGVLYMIAGLLNMAHEVTMCYIAGGIMVAIGMIAFAVGSRAGKSLATLRKSLSDDEFLLGEFLKHDRDRDGFLNPSEFAQFIWDLGLEFDDLNTLRAFTTIDTDHDQKIAYREFVLWWSQVRLNQL